MSRRPPSPPPCRAARSLASPPSVTRMPSFRPSKRCGPFCDDAEALADGPPDPAALAPPRQQASASSEDQACRRPCLPVASSMFSRCATMRSRITGVFTLLSSNVSATAIWCLLGRGLADEELPRLAVVIGKALRAQPDPSRLRSVGEMSMKPVGGGLAAGLRPTKFGW